MQDDPVWSFDELRTLVANEAVDQISLYCNSLVQKFRFCDFHANKGKKIFEDFHNPPNGIRRLGGSEMETLFFDFEGHFIAFLHILHSIPDTFSQIINIAVLNSRLTARNISFRSVAKKLKECGIDELASKLTAFLELPDFKYVDGFVNTLKHRQLIQPSYLMVAQEDCPAIIDFQFDSFEYDSILYPKRWSHEIFEMRSKLGIELVSIGCSTNVYLESLCRTV